jgi:hypothetical protein
MKTVSPSKLREHDCVLFSHKGERAVRRIVKVEHDESFATPSGGGDLFALTFEKRDGVPLRIECSPHVKFDLLEPQDVAAVMSAGFALVEQFIEGAVPAIGKALDELSNLSDDQLREVIERGEATRT